jgi:hypothetical protein
MALNINLRTARLRFEEGTILEGRDVLVSLSVPIRDYFTITRAIAALGPLSEREDIAPELFDTMRDVFHHFGEHVLLEWDIADDETGPVPATGDGFLQLPPDAASVILNEWAAAVGGMDPNLPAVSANGATSEARHVETAAL